MKRTNKSVNVLRRVLISLFSQLVKLADRMFEIWARDGIIPQAESTRRQAKHGLASL